MPSSGACPAPVNPLVADTFGTADADADADADGAIEAIGSGSADALALAIALGADDATAMTPVSVGATC